MIWYFPTWNGDLRLEPDAEHPQQTRLYIERPTLDEQRVLNQIGAECVNRGWLEQWQAYTPQKNWLGREKDQSVLIQAPLEQVGPVVTAIMRPGPAVLTAVRFQGGRVETTSGSQAELEALAQTVYRGPEASKEAKEEAKEAAKTALAKKESEKPTAAVTVKRPTPSCPRCVPGSIEPARQVLLAFLNPEEHESWAQTRTIVVEGGLTGHRYLLAHRHSQCAQRIGRCGFDLDSQTVMHFHDWSVPPEEEILAAKLILEHREPWLRNEATCFIGDGVFKNPFGDISDGVLDARLTQVVGHLLAGVLGVDVGRPPPSVSPTRRLDPDTWELVDR